MTWRSRKSSLYDVVNDEKHLTVGAYSHRSKVWHPTRNNAAHFQVLDENAMYGSFRYAKDILYVSIVRETRSIFPWCPVEYGQPGAS